eukprot:5159344-Pyramimonas_sp.AAC.1
MFLEHRPDVLKQERLRQQCSENISWEPQKGLQGSTTKRVPLPGVLAIPEKGTYTWTPEMGTE